MILWLVVVHRTCRWNGYNYFRQKRQGDLPFISFQLFKGEYFLRLIYKDWTCIAQKKKEIWNQLKHPKYIRFLFSGDSFQIKTQSLMSKNLTELSLASWKDGDTIHWHCNTSFCESWSGVNGLGGKAELTFQKKIQTKTQILYLCLLPDHENDEKLYNVQTVLICMLI